MKKRLFKWRLLPVILYMAVVVLLVKADSVSMDIGYWSDIPIPNDGKIYDLFYYVKSTAILYISVLSFIVMACLLISGRMKIKRTKIYIPMAVYTAMVIFSYAMSDYKYMAWDGNPSGFEGTKVILCYMFMLFYTINVVDEKRDAVIIISAMMIGVMLACLVGITQLIGHDILLSDIGKQVIAAGRTIKGEFESGEVYQTVGNMNYVGMYLALLVPILLYAFMILGNACKKRIFICILLVLIALNVYGAGSVGGLLGILVSIVAFVVFRATKSSVKIACILTSICASIVLFIIMYRAGADNYKQIDYIVTDMDSVLMSVDGNELLMDYLRDTREYKLYDENRNKLDIILDEENEGHFLIDDERFFGRLELIPIDNDGEQIMCIDLFDEKLLFRMRDDGVKFINPYGIDISMDKVPSFGFKGHLRAGSARAYIWSRTIPLLKNHLIIGSGADTFLLEFPQNDYAGKFSSGTPFTILFDKAHNLYLMMFVCTGGISCISFIIMIIMFLCAVAKSNTKDFLVRAIAAGIIGFCAAGLFNDSTVCTMPMFYGLLGIGSALLDQ